MTSWPKGATGGTRGSIGGFYRREAKTPRNPLAGRRLIRPMRFAVVLLAAGGSSRLGRPKQLLPYLGRTLVEHAARTALASGASEVVVVVGAEATAVRAALRDLRVRIVVNEAWAEGMGGSIARGVAALSEEFGGDRGGPRRSAAHQARPSERPRRADRRDRQADRRLVLRRRPSARPCAFAPSELARLRGLTGDAGARHLVRSGEEPVEAVAFSGANVDIDTPEDARVLLPEAEADAPAPPAIRARRRPRPAGGLSPLPTEPVAPSSGEILLFRGVTARRDAPTSSQTNPCIVDLQPRIVTRPSPSSSSSS